MTARDHDRRTWITAPIPCSGPDSTADAVREELELRHRMAAKWSGEGFTLVMSTETIDHQLNYRRYTDVFRQVDPDDRALSGAEG